MDVGGCWFWWFVSGVCACGVLAVLGWVWWVSGFSGLLVCWIDFGFSVDALVVRFGF